MAGIITTRVNKLVFSWTIFILRHVKLSKIRGKADFFVGHEILIKKVNVLLINLLIKAALFFFFFSQN